MLKKLNIDVTHNIDAIINKKRKVIIEKLVEAIDIEQSQTEEIEELKILKKKITLEMTKISPLSSNGIKNNIARKISAIQQKQLMDRIRNQISTNIENIVKDLADGTLDIEKAQEIINQEVENNLRNKPNNKFAITYQQEKQRILSQIKTSLKENVDKYNIVNPEITVQKIQNLCGVDLEQAMRTVEENLIARKDFDKAKELCKIFSGYDEESSISKYLRALKKEIRNAEISDMVLKGINMKGSIEKQEAYFELIEKGLEAGNVKLEAVSLGKNKDRSRNITLADVWYDNKKKERIR